LIINKILTVFESSRGIQTFQQHDADRGAAAGRRVARSTAGLVGRRSSPAHIFGGQKCGKRGEIRPFLRFYGPKFFILIQNILV